MYMYFYADRNQMHRVVFANPDNSCQFPRESKRADAFTQNPLCLNLALLIKKKKKLNEKK